MGEIRQKLKAAIVSRDKKELLMGTQDFRRNKLDDRDGDLARAERILKALHIEANLTISILGKQLFDRKINIQMDRHGGNESRKGEAGRKQRGGIPKDLKNIGLGLGAGGTVVNIGRCRISIWWLWWWWWSRRRPLSYYLEINALASLNSSSKEGRRTIMVREERATDQEGGNSTVQSHFHDRQSVVRSYDQWSNGSERRKPEGKAEQKQCGEFPI